MDAINFVLTFAVLTIGANWICWNYILKSVSTWHFLDTQRLILSIALRIDFLDIVNTISDLGILLGYRFNFRVNISFYVHKRKNPISGINLKRLIHQQRVLRYYYKRFCSFCITVQCNLSKALVFYNIIHNPV